MEMNEEGWVSVDSEDGEEIPEELKALLGSLLMPSRRRAERIAGIAFLVSMCGYQLQQIEGENEKERRDNLANNFTRSLGALGVTEEEAENAIDLVNTVLGESQDEFRWTPPGGEAEDV